MTKKPERQTPSAYVREAALRRAHSTATRKPQPVGPSADDETPHVACQAGKGLPTVDGKARGHYVSHRGGQRMLVLECGQGERIRINGTTEIVVLEICPEEVKVAIKLSPA